MKSLAAIIVINLVLSSPTTVLSVPHAHDSGFQGSLTSRPSSQHMWHSPLGGRLIETAPKGLFKRENNIIDPQKTRFNDDGHNDDDESDEDEDDTCEDSSDSSSADHHSTPNLHTPYKIGLNSTGAHPPKSKLPLQNSSSTAEYSAKPSQFPIYESPKEKHHIDSQRYDASFDNYASDSGKHHGFMGSYNGYHGKATFFSQGGSAGACGKVHQDSDYVVAIQSQMYDGGKFCGKNVIVTRKSTGKSITCVAADECPGCPTDQSLDLSVGAFNALGSPDEGIFDIHWHVMD